jgi:hypothetical protein
MGVLLFVAIIRNPAVFITKAFSLKERLSSRVGKPTVPEVCKQMLAGMLVRQMEHLLRDRLTPEAPPSLL